MEIGTLQPAETGRLYDLLDGWQLPDGWRGRDFFRRFVELDPTYRDENFFVAREGDSLLACVQVFPREIRVLGHAVPTGGIGSVFTRDDRRGEGLAGALLAAAAAAIRCRGMELSLLFSGRLSFYARHGFSSWRSQRAIVGRSSDPPGRARAHTPGAARDAGPDAPLEIAPFDAERDLDGVRALHARYSHERSGTVVRDDAMWHASLRLGGNPAERFTVARRGGDVAAYLRVTRLYERPVATELARADDAPDALAALVDASLAPHPDAAGSDLLLPTFDDLELTLALEGRGIASKPIEDPTGMLRCLDGPALARRIGAPMRDGETDDEFLRRAWPEDRFVFWPADRF